MVHVKQYRLNMKHPQQKHSQNDPAGEEEEDRILDHTVVDPAEPLQDRMGVLQVPGPRLPCLKHCGQVPERAAHFRGFDSVHDGKIFLF